MREVVAFDVETYPITHKDLAPKVVCCSFSEPPRVVGNTKEENLERTLRELFVSGPHLVGHNVAYDMVAILRSYPSLTSSILTAYRQQRVHDTFLREKLVHLGTHGHVDTIGGQRIHYSLAGLANDRLGVDISADKTGGIRTQYEKMDNIPASQYPPAFYNYSLQDAMITKEVFLDQEKELARLHKSHLLDVEWLHVNAAFCLFLMTVRGLKVDVHKKAEIQREVEKELSPSALSLLYSSGIITPGHSGKPYKRSPHKKTKPQGEKVNIKTHLIPQIETTARASGITLEYTETGRVSTASTFLAKLAPHSPVLKQFEKRASLIKLKTSYFPAMEFPFGSGFTAHEVHPKYDPLRRTGRVSSRGNTKQTKGALYASVNIQQTDPRIRNCYIPRKGFVFLSCDYTALELVCLAHTIHSLYGHSKLRDQLNKGIDPHAYLGAVLAGKEYKEFIDGDPMDFKYWRTLAKPIGLGYPGGMGVDRMMLLCHNYGFPITRLQAQTYKNIWLREYPEMNNYLAYPMEEERSYTTPMGMVRASCNYTEWCNGKGLQSPGAEGMKLAMFDIAQCCLLSGGALKGCFPVAQIHDELLLEVPEDDTMGVRVAIVASIMKRKLQEVLPSMNFRAIKVKSVLMREWSKDAKPVKDENGSLLVWEPQMSTTITP